MNREELEAETRKEQAQRVQACAAELQALLQRYNCEVFAAVGVTADGRLAGEVQLRAR